jgi:aminopeptidase N
MEYPGLVLTPDIPQVVAHELAHQWWYGLVGDDQWRSPWLDESFAEFSSRRLPAAVVQAGRLGCDHANPVRPFGRAPLTASMTRWNRAPASYFAEVYLGGTCALRSLERDLGRDAMTAFLRSYVDAHRWGVVTTADFVAALRAFAPTGYDVEAFLRRARIAH